VIGGAAGAIPPLLWLAQEMDLPSAREAAIAHGEGLLQTATRGARGYSWTAPSAVPACDLLGLAHGAGGAGIALLEVFMASGERKFAVAAEEAFRYEDSFFDAAVGNWPDFREKDVREFVKQPEAYDDRLEVLGLSRTLSPKPGFMSAWCHGAPGVGLTRLRAHFLTKSPEMAVSGRLATSATMRTLDRPGNHSLCHGLFGNCFTVLYASTCPIHQRAVHRA